MHDSRLMLPYELVNLKLIALALLMKLGSEPTQDITQTAIRMRQVRPLLCCIRLFNGCTMAKYLKCVEPLKIIRLSTVSLKMGHIGNMCPFKIRRRLRFALFRN